MAGNAYTSQLNDQQCPDLAKSFLCRAIIEDETFRRFGTCGWNCLRAAWVCDDKGDALKEYAVECRRKAAGYFEKALDHNQVFFAQEGGHELLLADLYRRSGLFEKVNQIVEQSENKTVDSFIRKLLDFQRTLADAKDTSCHKTNEVGQ